MSIELKNISKSYKSLPALNNVNLKITNGKNTVLIGPSGCGKSTLIKIIIGLIKPDKGDVYINKNRLIDEADIYKVRKTMGYVIQDGGLFPHLTAKENIRIMAKYLGWEKEKTEKRIMQLCELTKFPFDGLGKFPAELSGGQKQRVSLMRALMLNPEILLLDEPLGALDPLIRYDLQTDLKKIFIELKKTVVLVTHDMSEAAYFGDTIVLMKDGRIIQQAGLDEFISNPADPFVTRFMNSRRKITGV